MIRPLFQALVPALSGTVAHQAGPSARACRNRPDKLSEAAGAGRRVVVVDDKQAIYPIDLIANLVARRLARQPRNGGTCQAYWAVPGQACLSLPRGHRRAAGPGPRGGQPDGTRRWPGPCWISRYNLLDTLIVSSADRQSTRLNSSQLGIS